MKYNYASMQRVISGHLQCKSLHRNFCTAAHIIEDADRVNHILTSGPSVIRNFAIIAHIDHGKSTLSDRIMQHCGNRKVMATTGEEAQSLDTLKVERQRGITVKAQGASLFYNQRESDYMLNLIDTPGHVDFSYEVSRSLSASQGALLLIDASQGIEAQTIATYEQAVLGDLEVIPVLTKIDLPLADIDQRKLELRNIFDIDPDRVLCCSSKTGEGIVPILEEIVARIPPPKCEPKSSPLALLYDSWYDSNRGGVVLLVQALAGKLRVGDKIGMYSTDKKYVIHELGITTPELVARDEIDCGQVGYVWCQIRDPKECILGDTLYLVANRTSVPGKGFRERNQLEITPREKITPLRKLSGAKHMVFAGLYPLQVGDFNKLTETVNKLLLNDASVSVQKISSEALGSGFRCGFLGVLHMEVFRQRIEDDGGFAVLITAPTVPYRAIHKISGEELKIDGPDDYPENNSQRQYNYLQPWVRSTVVAPTIYMDLLMEFCYEREGEQEDFQFIGKDEDRALLKFKFPLAQVIADFHAKIKELTRGMASFDYEHHAWRDIDLVKVDIQINKKSVGPLSILVEKDKASTHGKDICSRLAEKISPHTYVVDVQAILGGKIVAKSRVKALYKNVLKKNGKTIGAGDQGRKDKILNREKERQSRMKVVGNVSVPQEAWMSVFRAKSGR